MYFREKLQSLGPLLAFLACTYGSTVCDGIWLHLGLLHLREKLQGLGPLLLALLRALMAALYVMTFGCTTVVFQRKASEPRPTAAGLTLGTDGIQGHGPPLLA